LLDLLLLLLIQCINLACNHLAILGFLHLLFLFELFLVADLLLKEISDVVDAIMPGLVGFDCILPLLDYLLESHDVEHVVFLRHLPGQVASLDGCLEEG
jgi:hypothetical protein